MSRYLWLMESFDNQSLEIFNGWTSEPNLAFKQTTASELELRKIENELKPKTNLKSKSMDKLKRVLTLKNTSNRASIFSTTK